MNFSQDSQRKGNTPQTDINDCILLKWILEETMCDDMDDILLA
jgi:hypothetical protein